MNSHAVHIDIGLRTDGDQITGHARVSLSQPEPFLGWLGFIGARDRPMGNPSPTGGPVPGSAAAMCSAGRQIGALRGKGQ